MNLKFAGKLCGLGTLLLGISAMIGWILHIPFLSAFANNKVPMAPSTALFFLANGATLFLYASNTSRSKAKLLVNIVCLFSLSCTSMILIASIMGHHSSVEHLGMKINGMLDGIALGHMSPVTATGFILFCSSMLLQINSKASQRWTLWQSTAFSFALALAGLVLITAYVLGGPLLYDSGIIPPALPTSIAFFLLGTGLLFTTLGTRQTESAGSRKTALKSMHIPALLLLLAAILVFTAGYYYFRQYAHHFMNEAAKNMSVVSRLKINELVNWRNERLGDASILMDNDNFRALAARFLADSSNEDIMNRMETWLNKLHSSHMYESVSFADTLGFVRLSFAKSRKETASAETLPGAAPELDSVLSFKKIIFTDLKRDTTSGKLFFYILIPITDKSTGRPIGVVVLRINPDDFIFPLLETWPINTRTAELLLVRKDGDDVLFMNRLRFRKDSALNLRFPLSEKNLPAAMAVNGRSGVVRGIDYRGEKVLAVIDSIPGTPWYAVVRMDLAEITAPVRERLWGIAGTIVALLFGIGSLAGFLWYRQNSRYYREHYLISKRIEASEATLKAVFDNAMDGMLVIDIKLNSFIMANSAACKMLGASYEEILSSSLEDIHPAEHIEKVKAQFDRQVKGEITINPDVPVKRKDGSVFYADINAAPASILNRECMIGVFRDITERKQSEEKILHLNAVLSGIRNVNQLITRERNRDLLIKQACDMLVADRGYFTVAVVLTSHIDSKVETFSIAGKYHAPIRKMLEAGKLMECAEKALASDEIVVRTKPSYDCRNCLADINISGEWDTLTARLEQDGIIYGFILVCLPEGMSTEAEEISLLKEIAGDIAFAIRSMEMEEERNKSKLALAEKEEQFRQAQRLEAVGRLAGGVAHDFNNILMVQLGYCDLTLKSLNENDPLAKTIIQIRSCAERAAGLTRQLLAFSRKQALQPVVLDINTLVGNIDKMLRRLIGEDIELSTILQQNLGRVKADPGQIEQVIMNLIVNARDAMPDGGKITLETSNIVLDETYSQAHTSVVPGRYVMLAITDTGSGMDEKTRTKLFEPFFTTKGIGKGTGLGLATVYGIVRQSEGHIWVYSEVGVGSTFKVYLPMVDDLVENIEKHESIQQNGSGKSILVVEDEPNLRELFKRMLEDIGYKAYLSSNGIDAIAAIKEGKIKPTLLLTDVVMPGMSGKILAEKIAEMVPGIKVIYMSGYTDNAIVHHGVLDTGIAFLQKPFGSKDLSAKIAEILR